SNEDRLHPIFLTELPKIQETHRTEENHRVRLACPRILDVSHLYLKGLLLICGHEWSAATQPVEAFILPFDSFGPNKLEYLIEVMVLFRCIAGSARSLIGNPQANRFYLLRARRKHAVEILEEVNRTEGNAQIVSSRQGREHGVTVVVKTDHLVGLEIRQFFDEGPRLPLRQAGLSKVNVAHSAEVIRSLDNRKAVKQRPPNLFADHGADDTQI